MQYITIRMTVQEALEHGLIVCTCGHPVNNHFTHRVGAVGGCAHCKDCLKYVPVPRVGTFVKAKRVSLTKIPKKVN